MKPILKALFISYSLLSVGHPAAFGQVLPPATETTANSVTVGAASVDGYYIYSTSSGDLISAPTYATAALTPPAGNSFGAYTPGLGGNYTELTVGGSAVETGIEYLNSPTVLDRSNLGDPNNPGTATPDPTNYYSLATITLGSGVPSSFTLGILNGNTNTVTNNPLYEVEVNGGTPTLLNAVHNTDSDTNDFYNLSFSGLNQGDTLTILGGNDPSFFNPANNFSYQNVIGFGGLVLSSSVATPEPSTYALMVAGLGLLLAAQRLNRRNA